ncbi:MAG: (Fe-S)-binding protein [Flavobacteriales bacterium]|nr:(Fe-S)-binding protein [Flavobacteriales bacterium]
MLAQILFVLLLLVAGYFAWKRYRFVRRNIELGKPFRPEGKKSDRWKMMVRVGLGQGKMFTRPLAAIMHFFIYAGFIIINIEVLEIVIDGVLGTHRVFAFMGGFYDFLIGSFEILAVLVLVACVVFLARRNMLKLKRFWMKEMTSWPRTDANLILIIEILLMTAFLTMNACDYELQQLEVVHYPKAGSFPVSSHFNFQFSIVNYQLLERICWWFHIIGILAFTVYLSYSKHLHIILAFFNTYYSKLKPAGEFNNLESVTREVKLMLDPSASVPPTDGTPQRFGAKDVFDLNWVQLLGAYSCTECGRCTSECPANQTGKLLSPRKIMMDTRDRLEEVGKKMDVNSGKWEDDGKSLLRDYISEEELWACTTCNACTEACPININPLDIIIDLRRYLIMEESKSPESITAMFNNIENNGAPWAMSAADRANWKN